MSGHEANKAITGYWLPTDRRAATVTSTANRDYLFDALHQLIEVHRAEVSVYKVLLPRQGRALLKGKNER